MNNFPLAHSLERFMWSCCFAKKLQYGFFQGDILKLREDLAVLKPTIMVSVPRLYNKFYDVMQQRIHQLSGAKRNLIDRAVKVKLENLAAKAETTHKFYDCLVFKNFKAVLGGRVRVLVTGSAPISKDVLNFLKIAFCCPILEGYGQTESCAPATITWIKDPSVGHVGAPFPPLDIKLVDVPEMKYLTSDRDENGQTLPRGEVCYRGHCAFKGYFRQPDQTEETIDRDGWVHTGDIGVFQQNGTVRIIDRKKNIFKLSQGEYIAPDKIEGKITQSIKYTIN